MPPPGEKDVGWQNEQLSFDETVFKAKLEEYRQIKVDKKVERAEAERRLESQMRQLRKNLNQWKVEIKGVPAGEEKAVLDSQFKRHEDEIKKLENDFRAAKQGKYTAPATTTEAGEAQTATQALDEAIDIQQQGIQALMRAGQYATHADQVADNTINLLAQQSERINEIDEAMNRLGGQLKRARKDVLWFVRSAMTDKCFLFLATLCVLCIAGIIGYQIYKKNKKSKATVVHSSKTYTPTKTHPHPPGAPYAPTSPGFLTPPSTAPGAPAAPTAPSTPGSSAPTTAPSASLTSPSVPSAAATTPTGSAPHTAGREMQTARLRGREATAKREKEEMRERTK